MKKRTLGRWHRLPAAAMLLLLAACARPEPPPPDPVSESLRIAALAPTASWLLSEVVGPGVAVDSLWGEDGLEPRPEDLERVLEADLVVRHGAGLDRWAETVELDASRLVDLSQGVDLIEREGTRHSHGDEGEHTHSEPLPETWHDVATILLALDAVERELVAREALDATRAEALRTKLQAFDARLTALAEAIEARVVGDSLAYLTRRLATDPPQDTTIQLRLSTERDANDFDDGIVLEALLPPPKDVDYAALIERNLDRLEAAAAARSP